MKKIDSSSVKTIITILIVLIVFGIFANLLLSCIERLVYPEDYYDIVVKYSNEYSVPAALTFAVIKVESNFDKNAKSSAGALGLMQMMPSTYEWLATKFNETPVTSLLFVPEVSIKYGTYYLQYLYSKFGTWEKALIAYNWGENNFKKHLDEYGYTEGNYGSIPVTETRNYVRKVIHLWEKYKKLYENI